MKKVQLNSTKLKLNKEKIASLTNDETQMIIGGNGDLQTNTELFGSRLTCNTNYDTQCAKTKSCQAQVCIPLSITGTCKTC